MQKKSKAASRCVEFLLLFPERKLCLKAAIVEASRQSGTVRAAVLLKGCVGGVYFRWREEEKGRQNDSSKKMNSSF